MTAELFLNQLEGCLHGLTAEERENAMSYYREYLEEAGEQANEAVEKLGSPQSVAEQILSEMRESQPETDAFFPEEKPSKASAGTVIFGILVLMITSPFWGTIAVLWLTLLFSLAVILLSLGFSAIFAPVQGISCLTGGMPDLGIYNIGAGIFCIGLVLLLWKPFFLLSANATRTFFGFCRNSLEILFRKDASS